VVNHQHLAELVSNFDEYREDLYWFIIFGDPSTSEPWGATRPTARSIDRREGGQVGKSH
jgi:hypothetical protein